MKYVIEIGNNYVIYKIMQRMTELIEYKVKKERIEWRKRKNE